MGISSAKLPVLEFTTSSAFEDWLERQPHSSPGAWLKFGKKASGVRTITKQNAIDCALCHGWIDGQLNKFDESYWLIRFTPRKPSSKWSRINRARATELIAMGRMKHRGQAEIHRAKADGHWDAAYPSQSQATVPDDLQQALDENLKAKTFFSELDGRNRYAVLYRIHNAKTAKLRASHIANFVTMLARAETIYPRK